MNDPAPNGSPRRNIPALIAISASFAAIPDAMPAGVKNRAAAVSEK
jgi:hypothetical protein